MPPLCEMSTNSIMKEVSNLTNKILAYKELEDFKMDNSIDWAVEMLQLGYETPSLLILAGISKPTNFFESEKYLIDTINELNLKIPERKEAIFLYCKDIITQIAARENIRKNLYQLYKIAQTINDDKRIFDFYLLYWAWGDFDYGQEYSHYWEDATSSNIEQVIVDHAQKWLTS